MISPPIPIDITHGPRSKRAAGAIPRAGGRTEAPFEIARVDERFVVITVLADLDFLGVKNLEKAIMRAAATSDGVVIDLLKCNVCDSASLAAMAKQKYVMRDALQFVIGANGAVRRAFEVTGLSGGSPMHATVAAAVAKLRS